MWFIYSYMCIRTPLQVCWSMKWCYEVNCIQVSVVVLKTPLDFIWTIEDRYGGTQGSTLRRDTPREDLVYHISYCIYPIVKPYEVDLVV